MALIIGSPRGETWLTVAARHPRKRRKLRVAGTQLIGNRSGIPRLRAARIADKNQEVRR
jgi:hypothetical protein